VRRRDFIALFGGAALATPSAARAQLTEKPVIGFLGSRSAEDSAAQIAAFREGLGESGRIASRDITITYVWADGRYDRLQVFAAEFVRAQVALVIAQGSAAAAAAKAATSTIPIVFAANDPLGEGLVASLSRPDGNMTGVSLLGVSLGAKRLELLRELIPGAKLVGLLLNPDNPGAPSERRDLEEAARIVGRQLHIEYATGESDFERAFAGVAQHNAAALFVGADALFTSRRSRLVDLAGRYKVPAIFQFASFAAVGGLMSYGPNLDAAYRQVGAYAARILKGAKPQDLPVQEPTKFELVVNLKTAKALGLTIPQSILVRADEVIE